MSIKLGRAWMVFALLLLCWGCEAEKSQEKQRAEQEQGQPAGEEVMTVEVKYPPDKAHRSVTYHIERSGESYIEHQSELPTELVDAVFAAADEGLLPSEGLRSCRDSQRNIRIRVTMKRGEDERIFESNSRCDRWAPWNVIGEGKLQVQLNGAFGAALLPLLRAMDQQMWAPVEHNKSGRIRLNTFNPPPEGLSTTPLPLPGLQDLKAWAPLAERFGDEVEVISMRLLCSQERSPDCSTYFAWVQIQYDKNKTLSFEVSVEEGAFKGIEMPPAGEEDAIKQLLDSQIFKAFNRSVKEGHVVDMSWAQDYDCRHVRGATPVLVPAADPSQVACDVLTVRLEYDGAETLPPVLHYYPALGAVRLEGWAHKTDPVFFEALKLSSDVRDTLILDRVELFIDFDGKVHEVVPTR